MAFRVCEDRLFEPIYFDFDEADIRVDQEPRLEANAECIRAFPADAVRIEGHADARGTEAYNLALGERRSRSAKGYLERLGIEGDRLTIVSYGETRPACWDEAESCWRQNRRAEITWR